jgi:DNA-binding response OmpR family regulator
MSTAFPEAPRRRASPTVMLIEPEPMLRLTMTEFLNRAGCRVIAYPDAKTGAEALVEGTVSPLLILLGARVLDAETADAARELRELAPGSAILGIADVIDPSASGGLPSDLRFLAPPFDLPDVLRAVRSHLQHAGYSLPGSELLEA